MGVDVGMWVWQRAWHMLHHKYIEMLDFLSAPIFFFLLNSFEASRTCCNCCNLSRQLVDNYNLFAACHRSTSGDNSRKKIICDNGTKNG
jgi:hypothetical protein